MWQPNMHGWVKRRRNKGTPAKRVAIIALLLVCAAPAVTLGQSAASSAPAPLLAPRPVMAGARPTKETPASDIFAGLTYTADQAAKIDQIHEKTQMHIQAAIKDQRLGPEERQAMITGYRRLEANEIFTALTPEQQRQVSKRVAERRAALQEEQQKQRQEQRTVVPPS